jgi:hypothetical protein
MVEGIEGLRLLIQSIGKRTLGDDPAAVRNIATKAGVLVKGSNKKKARIRLLKADVEAKLRAYFSRDAER